MGNKIILSFQPFILRQDIAVVNAQGNVLYQTTAESNIDDIMSIMRGLVVEYQVKDIIMHGSKDILQQYMATLKTNYDFKDLNIVIV